MTPKERLLKALKREPVDRPPVAVPTQNATAEAMEKAGVFWPAALREADSMANLALALPDIYGFEAARLPFDIVVEAETMGCETRYGGPADPPISVPKDRDKLDELIFPDPATSGRMAEVIKAVAKVSREKSPALPLIVALGTPFEVLCTVYNFDHLYEDLKEAPERLHGLLEKILDLQVRYGAEIVKAGADVIMLVDGTSQTLMPDQFRVFSLAYTARLARTLNRPAILHVCGNPTRLVKDMTQAGAAALSIDWPVPVEKAREFSAGKPALVGNLNVQKLFDGSPEDAARMARDALAAGFDIVAPGCGILPGTPLANIRAYVEEVKKAGKPYEHDGD